jgi:hypothetical protein
MNFLVSLTPEYVDAKERDKYAADGEPVIPSYPAPLANLFLSVTSFKQALHAEVRNLPDLNLDTLCEKLVAYYPGLPRKLHENYLFHTARAAAGFPVGTRFRTFITADTAKIQRTDNEQLFELWTEQPM